MVCIELMAGSLNAAFAKIQKSLKFHGIKVHVPLLQSPRNL